MSTADPKISIFLPSYNKGGFAVEAVRSVFVQSYQDWELHILENSQDDGKTRNLLKKFTDIGDPRVIYHEIDVETEIRQQHVVCPWLLNIHYPHARGEIIMYLSDDDLFQPGLFTAVVSYFANYPERDAIFFNMARTVAHAPGTGISWAERWMGIEADAPRGSGQVDCIIDGGQVAYRKRVLGAIQQPYFYTGKVAEIACHCDGLHLQALAGAGVTFYPVPVNGLIHRHTPSSTWSKDR